MAQTVELLLQADLERDSGAREQLAGLLYAHTEAFCLAGATERVQGWFDRLPTALRRRHPLVVIAETELLYRTGRYREGLHMLEDLQRSLAGRGSGGRFDLGVALPADFDFVVTRQFAAFSFQNGRYQDAITAANHYLARHRGNQEHEIALRRISLVSLYFIGRYEEAIETGFRLAELCRESPRSHANVLGQLVSFHIDLGRFARARDLMEEERAVLAVAGDPGMLTGRFIRLAEISVWEGDYAEALRQVQQGLESAERSGQAYYRTTATLKLIEVLNLLRRTAETRPWLEQLDRWQLSRWQEVRRDTAWAVYHARCGSGHLALQRIAAAVERYSQGPASGDLDTLIELADAAVETGAPTAERLIAQARLAIPESFVPYRVRLAWVQTRHAFRSGEPVSEPLGHFLALCEAHGLAGLLHQCAVQSLDILFSGLKAGVCSPLYPATLPELKDPQMAQLARLVADPGSTPLVRRVAFHLLSRQPGHPETQRALAAAAASDDEALRAAADRISTSLRVFASPRAVLEFRSLGGFAVLHQGQAISQNWRRKAQILFTMLLIQSPRPINRTLLAETLWPDLDPRAAANNLRVTIHGLRQGLESVSAEILGGTDGGDLLVSDTDSIRLRGTERILWDARQLEHYMAVARRCVFEGDDNAAVAALSAAAQLYKGPFLPDPAFDGYFDMERRHYSRLAYEAMTELAAFCLDRGEYEQALAAAESAVRIETLDEQGHLLVMRAHALMGFPHRAVEAYRRYEEILAREAGDQPSPGVKQLLLRLT